MVSNYKNDIEHLESNNIERSTPNPQLLWSEFKKDISAITKNHTRNAHHRLSSRITHLDADCQQLTEHPNFGEDNELRRSEAILVGEIEHLEQVKASQHQKIFKAYLMDHGEKLGRVWSALSKESKPWDLTYRLKIPNLTPPQYECNSSRMAELARNFHNNLQLEDLTHFNDLVEHEQALNKVLDAIPAA